mgnify:CR=1 FL=1
MNYLKRRWNGETGQTMAEYALILAVVGVGIVTAGIALSGAIGDTMCKTANTIETGAVSTTSVTITSFSRTTGLAQAWTDADVVVVSCMGY